MKEVNKKGYKGEIPEELFEQEKWEKLTPNEVEKGIARLKFKHPLANKPLWKILPLLKCFFCNREDFGSEV